MSPDPEVSPERVALVTVAFHSGGVLGEFLDSVPGSYRGQIEIIIADNSPDDGSAREAAVGHRTGYVAIAGNPGYGTAVNRAVDRLGPSTWLLVCNPDLKLAPGSVDELVRRATQPSVGTAGPRILEADGSIYPSARSVPSLRTGVGHALLIRIWPGNPWSHRYRRDDAEPRERAAGWLSGACLLIRRSIFDDLHGFDESYFMYFEDVDLGFRVGRRGLVNLYVPSATVTHLGGHSTQHSPAMVRAHHRSAERFVALKYSGRWMAPIRVGLQLGLRARAAILTGGRG